MRSSMWRFSAMGVILAASACQVLALEGMVLNTTRPQYKYGALVLTRLSTNKKDTLVSLPANAEDWKGCWGASFSTDGTKIAYAFNYSEIWTMNIDGANKKKICAAAGKEQYVNWTKDGYLWWGQCDLNIYRVKADGSQTKPEIMYTYKGNVHNLTVSQDAKIATWTYPAWLNAGYDFSLKKLYDFGGGCFNAISPDGTMMNHNIPGHAFANVWNFPAHDKILYMIKPVDAGATANLHRWSHHSQDIVFFHEENISKAYMHNIKTDEPNKSLFIGSGIAWDYFPQELTGPNPVKLSMGMSKDALSFTAQPGKAVTPALVLDTVVNKTTGTTLPTVTATSNQTWLKLTVAGTGNSQYIKNEIDTTKITTKAILNATVTVKAISDSVQYTVTCDARQATRAPVIVTQPAAGAIYKIGDSLVVAWDADCQQVPGVKVELSLDSGDNFTIIEVSGKLDCGVQTWKWKILPTINATVNGVVKATSTASNLCKVRVANYDGGGDGESNGAFIITAAGAVQHPVTFAALDNMGISVSGNGAAGLCVSITRNGSYTVSLVRPNGTTVKSEHFSAPGVYGFAAGSAAGAYLMSVKTGDRTVVQRSVTLGGN